MNSTPTIFAAPTPPVLVPPSTNHHHHRRTIYNPPTPAYVPVPHHGPQQSVGDSFVCGFICICGLASSRRENLNRHCDRNGCNKLLIRNSSRLTKLGDGKLVTPASIRRQQLNQKSKTDDYKSTREKLVPFIRSDESVDGFVPIFHPIVSKYSNFENAIRSSVQAMAQPNEDAEPVLSLVLVSAKRWIMESAKFDTSMVHGNYRAALQVFEGQDVNEVQQNYVYNFRHKPSVLLEEVKSLLCFVYRRRPILFEDFETEDDYFVPRILVELLLERTESLSVHPLIVEYGIMTVFKAKVRDITMISCGTLSSTLSEVMSLARAGVCSYLCSFEQDVHSQALSLVTKIRESPVLHTLAPQIRQLRTMQRKKPKRRLTSLDDFGNVAVEEFFFKKEDWSQIIPKILEKLTDVLRGLTIGNWWLPLLDVANPVRVRTGPDGDLHVVGVEASFQVIDPCQYDIMASYHEVAYHGTGGGSMRLSEIDEMAMPNLVWHRGTIYYSADPIKKFTFRSKTGDAVLRKLSASISRHFLVFRMVVRSAGFILDQKKVIPTRAGRGYKAGNAVSHMFSLQDTPSMTQVRHLWASISNYVFPDCGWDEYISANKEASEMAGHSIHTQRAKYSNKVVGGPEFLFNKYHGALGDSSYLHLISEELSDVDLQVALCTLYGDGAKYRSEEQRRMVLASSRKLEQHCLVNLPCGIGKSMAFILPCVAREVTGKDAKMHLVIAPYRFLVNYLYHNAVQMTQSAGVNINIRMFDGSDIGQGVIPDCLSNEEGSDFLATLVFCTLEAAEHLVQYHSTVVESWVKAGLLSRIFIDECHTVFAEESFRDPYTVYPKLVKFGVPVIALSGTLPRFMEQNVCRVFNMSTMEDASDVDIITAGDIMGT